MSKDNNKRIEKKAFILVMSLMIIASLFFFGLAFINLFMAEKQLSQRAEQTITADEAAQAGLEDALYQLKRSQTWNAGFNCISTPHSGAAYSMSFNSTQTSLPYSTNNYAGTTTMTGWGGRSIPPGSAHLVSVGSYGNASSTRQLMVAVTNMLLLDTFDSADTQWTRVLGPASDFTVQNSCYIIGSNGEHRTFAGSTSWTDMIIEVKATLTQGNGYGIYFRSSNINSVNSYIFQYDPGWSGGSFIYRKVQNGNEQNPFALTTRASIPSFAAGGANWWYNTQRTLRIEIVGNRFIAYVDNVKVLDATDTGNTFTSGEVGLRTWSNSIVKVDEMKVMNGASSTMTIKSRF